MFDSLTLQEYVKSLLDINDNTEEPYVSHMISSIENRIRIYCKYGDNEPLPKGLELLLVDICLNQIQGYLAGKQQGETNIIQGSGAVKKMTSGKLSIEYDVEAQAVTTKSGNANTSGTDFINEYESLLKQYIRKQTVVFV